MVQLLRLIKTAITKLMLVKINLTIIFQSPSGTRITIEVTRLNLPCIDTCSSFLEIKSKSNMGQTGARLCCDAPSSSITTEDNMALIMQRTDGVAQAGWRGWAIRYRYCEFILMGYCTHLCKFIQRELQQLAVKLQLDDPQLQRQSGQLQEIGRIGENGAHVQRHAVCAVVNNGRGSAIVDDAVVMSGRRGTVVFKFVNLHKYHSEIAANASAEVSSRSQQEHAKE